MKKFLVVTAFVMSVALMGSFAFGNPSMLPKHPGYPMGEFKDPVTGMATANDPGQQAPSSDGALKAAGRLMNLGSSIRPKKFVPTLCMIS